MRQLQQTPSTYFPLLLTSSNLMLRFYTSYAPSDQQISTQVLPLHSSGNGHFLSLSSPLVSLGKELHSKAIFQETSPPTNAHIQLWGPPCCAGSKSQVHSTYEKGSCAFCLNIVHSIPQRSFQRPYPALFSYKWWPSIELINGPHSCKTNINYTLPGEKKKSVLSFKAGEKAH